MIFTLGKNGYIQYFARDRARVRARDRVRVHYDGADLPFAIFLL